jgi:hypothetical protein
MLGALPVAPLTILMPDPGCQFGRCKRHIPGSIRSDRVTVPRVRLPLNEASCHHVDIWS